MNQTVPCSSNTLVTADAKMEEFDFSPLYNYLPEQMTRAQLRSAYFHSRDQIEKLQIMMSEYTVQLQICRKMYDDMCKANQHKEIDLNAQITSLTFKTRAFVKTLNEREVAIKSMKEIYHALERVNNSNKMELEGMVEKLQKEQNMHKQTQFELEAALEKLHNEKNRNSDIEIQYEVSNCLNQLMDQVEAAERKINYKDVGNKLEMLERALEEMQIECDVAKKCEAKVTAINEDLKAKLHDTLRSSAKLEGLLLSSKIHEECLEKENEQMGRSLEVTLGILAALSIFLFLYILYWYL